MALALSSTCFGKVHWALEVCDKGHNKEVKQVRRFLILCG